MKNNIYKLYLDGLDMLINKKINLKRYDEFLEKNYPFICPSTEYLKEKEVKSIILNSKYFFLSNRLYLNKLNEDERNVLLNSNESDKVLQIVENTFKRVIKKDNVDIVFASSNCIPLYSTKSGNLSLFLIYSIKNDDDESFLKMNRKKDEVFNKIKMDIKNDFKNNLDIDISIFEYFNY